MTLNLGPLEILAGLGALIVMFTVWRASVRRARRIATAARETARLTTLAGRVTLTAAMFGGVQWVLLTHPSSPYLLVGALAIPDLFAGYVLARALTVTTVGTAAHRRGGGRR